MAKSVLDAGWSDFKRMLSYKSIRNGGSTLEVSEYLTTQVCSECGCLPPSRPKGISNYERYSQTSKEASAHAFDRETGKPIPADKLKTYAQALAQYHLRPEAKFENGDYLDSGPTRRRHVQATQINYIGKEANRWEEQFFLGMDEDAVIEYGADPKWLHYSTN